MKILLNTETSTTKEYAAAVDRLLDEVKRLTAERDVLKQANSDLAKASIIPEGWQLVPEEISEAMYEAYHKVDDAAWCAVVRPGANMSEIWEAMLEAAKEQQT